MWHRIMFFWHQHQMSIYYIQGWEPSARAKIYGPINTVWAKPLKTEFSHLKFSTLTAVATVGLIVATARTAAPHGPLNRIFHMAPICTHILMQKASLSSCESVTPNGISIGLVVFAGLIHRMTDRHTRTDHVKTYIRTARCCIMLVIGAETVHNLQTALLQTKKQQ